MGKGQSSTRLSTEHRPYDLNTIMGDFSAKIGSDNSGYEDTIGTQALGEKNDSFCTCLVVFAGVRHDEACGAHVEGSREDQVSRISDAVRRD